MPIKKSDLKIDTKNLEAKRDEERTERKREEEGEKVSAYLAKFKTSDLERYKEFCLKKRMTLRQLIETSVDYLVRQCEEERLVITSSGVYERK